MAYTSYCHIFITEMFTLHHYSKIIIMLQTLLLLGAIQVLRNAGGMGGGINFSGKKRYEGVRFNVIRVTRGWVGVQFPEKSIT